MDFLIAHVNSGVKMANEQAWKHKLPDMQKGARWSRVYGSLSAAMASLMDAGFEVPSINHWVDPSGEEWYLDFSEPMFVPAVREVLQYFLFLGVWDRAQNHVFGSSLGLRPDLRPGKSRIRQAKKQQKWHELYFLEAIMQGSMDLHAEASLVTDDQGVIRCKWCGAAVHESAWIHLSWRCEHFLRSPEAEIQQSAYLVPEAVEALVSSPTLWPRGIPSLPLEEAPLSLQYWAYQAGPDCAFQRMDMNAEPINVEGCLMGGDCSGGEHTKDPDRKSVV